MARRRRYNSLIQSQAAKGNLGAKPRLRPRPHAKRIGTSLQEIPLPEFALLASRDALPADTQNFLLEAEQRITEYYAESRTPAFVPSDYGMVHGVLRTLAEESIAPGNTLCEWGSGFGIVACLAAMQGFDACGIEIEETLVDAARLLAADFTLPVEFYCASFIPEGGEAFLDDACDLVDDGFSWLKRGHGSTPEELGLAAHGYDVVYAYPWPDEECAIADLFQRYAAVGAVLMTYHGGEGIRLRRKLHSIDGRCATRRRHRSPE